MFDINTLISVSIDPSCLAATGGMLLSTCDDKELAHEFAAQSVHQMMIAGVDPDEVMSSDIGELDPVAFHVPIGIVMAVSAALVEISDGPEERSVAVLMRAWKPALLEIVALLKPDKGNTHPFDEHGNCMN